jgi:hypothetical protein
MEKRSDLIHTALFVDFDNVYINLAQLDSHVGAQFATNPDRWLAWLEQNMPIAGAESETARRRILIRRCYLNPRSFATYRPYFILSAFDVIDCPPLTARGKTSTDIHMVMDILDALNHATYFDEFIVLSGDADFTPVLLRLRTHGRYSAILATGYVSPAYKASCDFVIPQDVFIREALGVSHQDIDLDNHWEEVEEEQAVVLDRMAARLYEETVSRDDIKAYELPGVYKEFPEFRQNNNWLGFFSSRRLTDAVVSRRDDLQVVEEDDGWSVVRANAAPAPAARTAASDGAQSTRNAIAAMIRETVAASKTAVPMGLLAQRVSQQFSERIGETEWLGAGTFKNLLSQLDLGDLQTASAIPGYVYDPAQHEAPKPQATSTQPQTDDFALKHPGLAALAWKIHKLTELPYLSPEHYALLLQQLADEVNERGYQITATSKAVRDHCVEKGAPIARSHVNFVLFGISYAGHRIGLRLPENARELGEALVQNTINLCRTAQMDLSDEETAQIGDWIMGALPEPPEPGPTREFID